MAQRTVSLQRLAFASLGRPRPHRAGQSRRARAEHPASPLPSSLPPSFLPDGQRRGLFLDRQEVTPPNLAGWQIPTADDPRPAVVVVAAGLEPGTRPGVCGCPPLPPPPAVPPRSARGASSDWSQVVCAAARVIPVDRVRRQTWPKRPRLLPLLLAHVACVLPERSAVGQPTSNTAFHPPRGVTTARTVRRERLADAARGRCTAYAAMPGARCRWTANHSGRWPTDATAHPTPGWALAWGAGGRGPQAGPVRQRGLSGAKAWPASSVKPNLLRHAGRGVLVPAYVCPPICSRWRGHGSERQRRAPTPPLLCSFASTLGRCSGASRTLFSCWLFSAFLSHDPAESPPTRLARVGVTWVVLSSGCPRWPFV